MMVTCNMCETEFLTEADPHVIIPSSKGYLPNCGCYFTKPLQEQNRKMKEFLDEIARPEDTRYVTNFFLWTSRWRDNLKIEAQRVLSEIGEDE